MKKAPVVIIISISSDIGFYLAKKYLNEGYKVIGTYRFYHRKIAEDLESNPNCALFYCDVSYDASILHISEELKKHKIYWDIFISCIGDLRPHGSFFETDFKNWSDSVNVNAIGQLRIIHELYPFRNQESVSSVVFFAGGGVNNAPTGLSAYTASKIMLIKMCELLDAENPDLKVFSIGPGYIKTKIHKTIEASVIEERKETALADVYAAIRWLTAQDKQAVGGRNFSVVNDFIGSKLLAESLRDDGDMYKLRRFENDFWVK